MIFARWYFQAFPIWYEYLCPCPQAELAMQWSVLVDFRAEITQRVPSWRDFLDYELELVRNVCHFACRICDDTDLAALTLCYNLLTNLRFQNLDAVDPCEAMPESSLTFTGVFNRSDGFENVPLYMRFQSVLWTRSSRSACRPHGGTFSAIGEMPVMLLAAGKINDGDLESCLSSALRALNGIGRAYCRYVEIDWCWFEAPHARKNKHASLGVVVPRFLISWKFFLF